MNSTEPIHPEPIEPIKPSPRRRTPFRLLRWALGLSAVSLAAATGGLIWAAQGIQSFRYYDWTIVSVSDNQIAAACNQITFYYMRWQDTKTARPVGHQIEDAKVSQCISSSQYASPAARFPVLSQPIVLSTLGCKAEPGVNGIPLSWKCRQPVGKLLKQRLQLQLQSQPQPHEP